MNSMKNEIKGPIDDFKSVLLNESIDTGIDLLELCLDNYIANDIIRDIPIIGTGYSVGKVFIGVKDLALTKKVLIFSQKVRKGMLSDNDIREHLEILQHNPQKLHKELEIIMNYLDRHTKYTKALILANFYLLYLDKKIEWEDFDYFAEIIDGISVYDLKVLKIVWEKEFVKQGEKYNPVSLQRLRNHGLVEYHDGVTVQKKGSGLPYIATINEIGKFFCVYGMNDVWDKVMDDSIIV